MKTIPPARPHSYRMLVGRDWVDAASGERYTRESPAHDVPVSDYPLASATDVDRAVAAARRAFDDGPWPRVGPFFDRRVHRAEDGAHAPGAASLRVVRSFACR